MSKNLRKPDFIGIGAEKAGTTWLWEQLVTHPNIAFPYPKELRYFAHRDYDLKMALISTPSLLLQQASNSPIDPVLLSSAINELRSRFGNDENYLEIFGELPDRKIVGEISPQYASMSLQGISHIASVNPEVRLIYIIRDPVERAISGSKMKLSEEGKQLTVSEIVKRSFGPHQRMLSNYPQVIENYHKTFSAKNLLVVFYDEIKHDPYNLLKQVCIHIGVDFKPEFFPSTKKVVFQGTRIELPPAAIFSVYQAYLSVYEQLTSIFPERVNTWRKKYEEIEKVSIQV
jgi:Sulfotransferase family